MYNHLALLSSLLLASSAFVTAVVTCLDPGQIATARFVNGLGETCTWTGTVGVNFGVSPLNGQTYDCNGRCGAGCTGAALNNFWTQDCFSHDICSWFYGSTEGIGDINCGNAFQAAIDDTTLGGLNLCTRGNPNVGVTPPTTGLVCTGGAKKVRRGDDDEGDDEERDDDREGDDDEGDDKNEG